MMELMSQVALETGAARRREVALAAMQAGNAETGIRHALGVALIAVGQRIAGGVPVTGNAFRPNAAGSESRGI